jgi:hypothetical protein
MAEVKRRAEVYDAEYIHVSASSFRGEVQPLGKVQAIFLRMHAW